MNDRARLAHDTLLARSLYLSPAACKLDCCEHFIEIALLQ